MQFSAVGLNQAQPRFGKITSRMLGTAMLEDCGGKVPGFSSLDRLNSFSGSINRGLQKQRAEGVENPQPTQGQTENMAKWEDRFLADLNSSEMTPEMANKLSIYFWDYHPQAGSKVEKAFTAWVKKFGEDPAKIPGYEQLQALNQLAKSSASATEKPELYTELENALLQTIQAQGDSAPKVARQLMTYFTDYTPQFGGAFEQGYMDILVQGTEYKPFKLVDAQLDIQA